jgi:hypothetical protein
LAQGFTSAAIRSSILLLRNRYQYILCQYDIFIIRRRCMQRILITVPDSLAARMKVVLPPGQRSRVISRILEDEVVRREQELYDCAVAVEGDSLLNEELEDWNVTTGDGVDNETW